MHASNSDSYHGNHYHGKIKLASSVGNGYSHNMCFRDSTCFFLDKMVSEGVDKQAQLFVDTADQLAVLARDTLTQAW